MELKTVYGIESRGKYHFQMEIKLATDNLTTLKHKTLKQVINNAAEMIQTELLTTIIKFDPDTPGEIIKNRKLLSIFPDPIFVQEIPNEYDHSAYSRHLPWFIVTTTIGRFKIGWRKRVIHIDWSDTLCTEYSADLFRDINTTKYDHYIHAWSLEDAKEYIKTIIEAAVITNP